MGHIETLSRFSIRTHLASALRKYGVTAFTIDLLEEVATEDNLNDRERFWISHYDSTTPAVGYNMTAGGDGGLMTLEVRLKISATKTGVVFGPQPHRGPAISAGKLASGYKHSEETRKKIRENRRPYVTSEDHKQKISNTLRSKIESGERWGFMTLGPQDQVENSSKGGRATAVISSSRPKKSVENTCEGCLASFTRSKVRRFCSRKCNLAVAGKLSADLRRGTPLSEETKQKMRGPRGPQKNPKNKKRW